MKPDLGGEKKKRTCDPIGGEQNPKILFTSYTILYDPKNIIHGIHKSNITSNENNEKLNCYNYVNYRI